jgi:hypothetical protein
MRIKQPPHIKGENQARFEMGVDVAEGYAWITFDKAPVSEPLTAHDCRHIACS